MSEKWTDGPWHVEIGTEYDDHGTVYVCHPGTSCPETVICKFEDYNDEQDRGNGYLIAAAPDLYAALVHLEHNARASGCEMGLALDFATDALKKARGES